MSRYRPNGTAIQDSSEKALCWPSTHSSLFTGRNSVCNAMKIRIQGTNKTTVHEHVHNATHPGCAHCFIVGTVVPVLHVLGAYKIEQTQRAAGSQEEPVPAAVALTHAVPR